VHPWHQFTVDERAARWQRRYTGPWRTVEKRIGPVGLSTRYRRRERIEFVALSIALRDLQRDIIVGLIVPLNRALAWTPRGRRR